MKSREEKSEVKNENKYLMRIKKNLKLSVAYISTFSCNKKTCKSLFLSLPQQIETNKLKTQQFPLVNQRTKGQTNIVRLKKWANPESKSRFIHLDQRHQSHVQVGTRKWQLGKAEGR